MSRTIPTACHSAFKRTGASDNSTENSFPFLCNAGSSSTLPIAAPSPERRNSAKPFSLGFMEPGRNEKSVEMPPHGFLGRIPEDALGGLVPQGNAALRVDHDDRVLGRAHDAAELLLALASDSSARRCSVWSRKTSTTPVIWPCSLRMGAPLSAMGRSVPSRASKQRVVGEVHDRSFAHDALDRVVDLGPASLR